MPNCSRFQLWIGSLLTKRNDVYCCTIVDTWKNDEDNPFGTPILEFDSMEDADVEVENLNRMY